MGGGGGHIISKALMSYSIFYYIDFVVETWSTSNNLKKSVFSLEHIRPEWVDIAIPHIVEVDDDPVAHFLAIKVCR